MTTKHESTPGLFGIDFEVKDPESITIQKLLDTNLSSVWSSTKNIKDTTREHTGDHFEYFTGDRFHLFTYGRPEPQSGQNQFVILDNVLPFNQCRQIEQLITNNWKPLRHRYRDADVYIMHLPKFCQEIESALSSYIPFHIADNHGDEWEFVGLNDGFVRLIQYVKNATDDYPLHFDLQGSQLNIGNRGKFSFEHDIVKTMLTFNMYLNGSETFSGGTFRVYDDPDTELFSIQPAAGRAFLFRQGQTKGYLHSADTINIGI